MDQSSISNKKAGFLVNFIANGKERKLVIKSLIVAICLICVGVLSIFLYRGQLMTEDFRQYKGTIKQFGSISRIGFFAVLSIYPVFLIMKSKKIKEIQVGTLQLKTIVQFIGKLVRKWHAPVALLSTGIVFLHVYMAIIRGFKLDFTYISGIITTLILPFLLFMGLRRYKRNDQTWHFKLAIGFLILFMIHATF